jgi:ketosteroid isomerase-like protein
MTATAAAGTSAIANELVELCRRGRNDDAIDRFYARDIVSVESVGTPEMPAEMKGIDAVRKKNDWWTENNEVHTVQVNGPFVGEDQFAVQYTFDTTFKPTGQRTQMSEMALYQVKDGKIVREQFFYHIPGA